MSPLYEFTCACGHTTEKRTEYGKPSVPCALCGQPAKRESVYLDQSVFGETTAKHMRRADVPRDEKRYDKQFKEYKEASAEIEYAVSKVEKETGQKVKIPDFLGAAKKKAARIRAGMEAPLG